ncbi:unnamed protein product [Rotaria socialis]|uniref:Sulfatase N-terminal domain-containing protein n=2 Tax=Rotaria socialis TaxID=392032 RepID=A0A821QDS6_9BILA|nr:unnamed protein product [Rotaria socialis]
MIVLRQSQAHKHQRNGHLKTVKILATCLIFTYLLTILFFRLPEQYTNLSSNMVLIYFSKLVTYYWRKIFLVPIQMEQAVLNRVAQLIRAPAADISRPSATLKRPIKHVFIIVLESIRADAVPLNESLANAVNLNFTFNTTAETVTPLLSSLWTNSVHTIASVASSYTLKSLLSIFCGIYPINVNFLKEANPENILYEKCLPELLREIFLTNNNEPAFSSAFFTAARDDFDHQREIIDKMKFDTVRSASNIYHEIGYISDLGMFGPADPHILPLLWKWIDQNLAEQPTKHLMTSLLITGTHEPFPMPHNQRQDEYYYYIDESHINNYLNALHITDKFIKEIIDGFVSRHLYDDTLFVITSDHGYVFNDHGRETLGLLSTPLESALSVPLILHNPHLEAKQLNGQFTTMDILPTIIDVLLSSIKSAEHPTNQLLSVPSGKLQSIFSRYEGTSVLRMPIAQQPARHTFQLSNPGNSYIIVKQYPRKLTYDVANDQVHLYHLGYDPLELVDLIVLDDAIAASHPPWVDILCDKSRIKRWKGLWQNEKVNTDTQHNLLLENKTFLSIEKSNAINNSSVRLKDMLDWADQAFEVARLWKNLVKQRYHYNSDVVSV